MSPEQARFEESLRQQALLDAMRKDRTMSFSISPSKLTKRIPPSLLDRFRCWIMGMKAGDTVVTVDFEKKTFHIENESEPIGGWYRD